MDEEVAGLLATALPLDGRGWEIDVHAHITIRTQVISSTCPEQDTLWS